MATRKRKAEASEFHKRGSALQSGGYLKSACKLGELLLRTDEFAEAEEAFRAVLLRAPGHRDALWGLAEALQRQRRIDEAREILQRVREVESSQPHIQQRIGILLYRLGDFAEAAQLFRAILEKHPDQLGVWENLAECLSQTRDTFEEALAILRPRAQAGSQNFRATVLMGHLLSRRGEVAESKPYFQAALDMMPHNEDAMFSLTVTLAHLKVTDQLAPLYARFREAGGTSTRLHSRIGEIMLARGDLATAETAFRTALAENPSDADASAGLAKVQASAAEAKLTAQ